MAHKAETFHKVQIVDDVKVTFKFLLPFLEDEVFPPGTHLSQGRIFAEAETADKVHEHVFCAVLESSLVDDQVINCEELAFCRR